MSQDYGIQAPRASSHETLSKPARYLVLIDSSGSTVARLFLDTREQVAEFDAGADEVRMMIAGLSPVQRADGPEWDRALAGHTAAERSSADVYRLDP